MCIRDRLKGELYEKAPSLGLGKRFRVEDGSIRVHRQRKERGRKVVHSQIVCDALGDAKSRTGKLVTLSSGRTTFMCCRTSTTVPTPNTCPVKQKQVALQPIQHTDGITYTRCMQHVEITDESLGLAKPKAKPAKGPMRPELDVVVKPGLGLKQQPKQRQGLLTNMFQKKEPVAAAAEPETIDLS